MKTLNELWEEHGSGVKARYSNWKADRYFVIMGKARFGFYGYREAGEASSEISDGKFWELYQEPKKKKKYYAQMYLTRYDEFYAWNIIHTEEENHKSKSYSFKRLPQFDIEIEE